MSAPEKDPQRDDSAAPNFIFDIIREDLDIDKNSGRLQTRFPPEPNGYLHIGHAKAICINFEGARLAEYGACNLRFDDTNPEAEESVFVQSIQKDVAWLGYAPGERVFFASSYFEKLYEFAVKLVEKGLAYVDSQSPEQIKENRGNYHRLGVNSPFRDRPTQENLALLEKMRAGHFDEGSCVLRAKIDMEHKDVLLRDPLIYRIRKAHHHRTGDEWCIYPMYDFAHPLSDAIEGVTHSLCSLEFESHRPLYNWFVEKVGGFDPVPRQIEFAKLAITYVVLSKRRLKRLVDEGHVEGWDDPRMPTLAGMRRRGYLPESIRAFCERVGVAKRDSLVDIALFEHRVREDLNARADRTMAVLRPLRVTIENFEPNQEEVFEVPLHPEHPEKGTRKVTLTRKLFVEQDDYLQEAPKKWFRLAPGKEVRLRGACFVTVKEAIYEGQTLRELIVTWDPESRGGSTPDGRRVKGTIHWISEKDAQLAEVRLYDRLFTDENPTAHDNKDFIEFLNPQSLETCREALVFKGLGAEPAGTSIQFERLGYFCVDESSTEEVPVFNRTIGLRDSWAKQSKAR